MAGRYVPPHLRHKQKTPENPTPEVLAEASAAPLRRTSYSSISDDGLLTLEEIHTHFWRDVEYTSDSNHNNSTLHSSADNPDSLAWVLLFSGANPKWESDGTIFVKSNLGLLPAVKCASSETDAEGKEQEDTQKVVKTAVDLPSGLFPPSQFAEARKDQEDSVEVKENVAGDQTTANIASEGVPLPHRPFAVFAQMGLPLHCRRCFKFIGWHKISRLQILAPQSEGLVRMLAKKWEVVDKSGRVHQRKRNEGNWKKSMAQWWAVIKMEAVNEETAQEMGELTIERIEEDDEEGGVRIDNEGKSVNELLAELRLKDENKKGKGETCQQNELDEADYWRLRIE